MRILYSLCLAVALAATCNAQGLSLGTLKGAIPGLKHVADLGASVAYLGPIAKRSARPHASPYNIADYNAVDPQYGTEADLLAFIRAAHQLGLKVMLDLVYY